MADSGTPLVAVRDARVIEGNDGGRGNYVALYSPAEDQTYVYFHMLRPSGLKVGVEVPAGTQVGVMGCTGSCYGTHLHFEIRLGEWDRPQADRPAADAEAVAGRARVDSAAWPTTASGRHGASST